MPKNKIDDLRNMLFETMEKLLDDTDPMDTEQAKAIANVGRAIIETAKVEIEFLREVGGIGSGFIPMEPKQIDKPKD